MHVTNVCSRLPFALSSLLLTTRLHAPLDPDGLMLFCGTMFAPVQDRDASGAGFTHKRGDVVTVETEALGALVNTVDFCDRIPQWKFGVRDLMANLSQRGLI